MSTIRSIRHWRDAFYGSEESRFIGFKSCNYSLTYSLKIYFYPRLSFLRT